ncbi:MAG: 2Fe-2S iron-sulfur cluster binding domain-containing protein [Candidatus Lokiarchaeota archaeon]|nr:2Fe-2S iron-sulfur cluster binding domain-containing protein [Candidatus Lokiarchaeota archaeon]MBD3199592.1 2Fe-2S iron-sulfur cluster binding domain-containing protein [Candidatus Lokiarchaeota archaeon]
MIYKMMKDIKKYQKAEKLKKWANEVQEIPAFKDKFEHLKKRLHPKKQILKVSHIKKLSHDTVLLRLISNDSLKPLSPYRAGQYIGLTVEINGIKTIRPYSLVSSPNQLAYYELGIKRKQNGFVSPYLVGNVNVGDKFEATEPLGQFYHNPLFHGNKLVFIAGGCGITPFMSMLRYFTELSKSIEIWLIFGCLTQQDILFKEELDNLQNNHPNIHIDYVLSEANSEWKGLCGFITKEVIAEFLSSPLTKFYYICGNRAMYDFILNQLIELNIPRHHILFEAFGVPDDVTEVIGWPEELTSSDEFEIKVDLIENGKKVQKIISASCTEPLLNTLERKLNIHEKINSGCRSGDCALCRTKLESGMVFVPPEVNLREADKNFGYIHPCISYPITEIHLNLKMI